MSPPGKSSFTTAWEGRISLRALPWASDDRPRAIDGAVFWRPCSKLILTKTYRRGNPNVHNERDLLKIFHAKVKSRQNFRVARPNGAGKNVSP
jgi:hypothetical protein